jgi:prophage regulatory protein
MAFVLQRFQHSNGDGDGNGDFNTRLPAVKTRVGLSRSAIYLAVSRAEFPRPVQLGARAVGWLESEIEEWIRERVKHSQKLP